MKIKVGINGFGRIGRLFLRAVYEDKKLRDRIEIVGINDLIDVEYMVYMLRYDSAHGRFSEKVEGKDGKLYIAGEAIRITSERDPLNLQWDKVGAEYIVESTGLFLTNEKASAHLKAGAKKVVMSAPSKDKDTPMFVMGVNHNSYNSSMDIVSNASCTTNCLAPLSKVIDDHWGLQQGLMTTIHASTATQKVVDSPSAKNWRAGRAAINNIIPNTTGAAKAIGRIIPHLSGKLTGMAFRVPAVDVSVVDLTCTLEKPTSHDAIAQAMKKASENEMKGVLAFFDEEIVSTDCLHDAHTCIFDANATTVLSDKFIKLVAWYDNEWGYSNKVAELICHMASQD